MARKKGMILSLREETEGKLRKMIQKELGVTSRNVRNESEWQALGADSVDKISVCMNVEEEYQIEISDEAVGKIETFGDLMNYVCERRYERGDKPGYS